MLFYLKKSILKSSQIPVEPQTHMSQDSLFSATRSTTVSQLENEFLSLWFYDPFWILRIIVPLG